MARVSKKEQVKKVSEKTSAKRKADKILTKSKNVTILEKPLLYINENDEPEEIRIHIVSKIRGITSKMETIRKIKELSDELRNKENLTEFDEAELSLEFYKNNIRKHLTVKVDDEEKLKEFLANYFETDDEIDISKILDVDYEYCILDLSDIPIIMMSILSVYSDENMQ